VIDLSSDEDPAALIAMPKFCYDGIYHCYKLDGNAADQHVAMYRVADLYDIITLRDEPSSRFVISLKPVHLGHGVNLMTDETVLLIQQVLGPDADPFADNSIQQKVYRHVLRHSKVIYNNALLRRLLADGSMFNESYAQRFTDSIGQLVSGHNHVYCCCYPSGPSSPRPISWDALPAEARW
jgi:hypothetical protein